jgi:hypothetical protein
MSDLRVVYPLTRLFVTSDRGFFDAIAAIGVRTSTFIDRIFGIVATAKVLVRRDPKAS